MAGNRAYFAADLAESVAFGDARYRDVRQLLTEQLAAKGIDGTPATRPSALPR